MDYGKASTMMEYMIRAKMMCRLVTMTSMPFIVTYYLSFGKLDHGLPPTRNIIFRNTSITITLYRVWTQRYLMVKGKKSC